MDRICGLVSLTGLHPSGSERSLDPRTLLKPSLLVCLCLCSVLTDTGRPFFLIPFCIALCLQHPRLLLVL